MKKKELGSDSGYKICYFPADLVAKCAIIPRKNVVAFTFNFSITLLKYIIIFFGAEQSLHRYIYVFIPRDSDFMQMSNPFLGNCYTFNSRAPASTSARYLSTMSGRRYGKYSFCFWFFTRYNSRYDIE